MDGFETIARLKGDNGLKNIPVIFLTGNSDADTKAKCLGAGAVDILTKPADAEILHNRIGQHIKVSV